MLVILPETSSFQGVRVAERVREAVENLRVEGMPRVSVSIGVSELGKSWEKAIEAADQALYAAKHAGRNCVRRVGEELPTLPPPTSVRLKTGESPSVKLKTTGGYSRPPC